MTKGCPCPGAAFGLAGGAIPRLCFWKILRQSFPNHLTPSPPPAHALSFQPTTVVANFDSGVILIYHHKKAVVHETHEIHQQNLMLGSDQAVTLLVNVLSAVTSLFFVFFVLFVDTNAVYRFNRLIRFFIRLYLKLIRVKLFLRIYHPQVIPAARGYKTAR